MLNFLFKNQSSKLSKMTKLYNIPFSNFAKKIMNIKLGDLGEGTKDATIKQWYKKVGDIVKEVSYVKVNM